MGYDLFSKDIFSLNSEQISGWQHAHNCDIKKTHAGMENNTSMPEHKTDPKDSSLSHSP